MEKRVSPYTFRHPTATTYMLRNHADLCHIQAILGHTNLRTAQVYTHVDIEDLKEVVRRSHPHGRRGRLPPGESINSIDAEGLHE